LPSVDGPPINVKICYCTCKYLEF